MSGLKLAALYGFPPYNLGFCGAQGNLMKKALLAYLSGEKISEGKIRKILETFKSAFSYYKLIAKCSRIKDPFNEKVVKAYWIGNDLLERVPASSLEEMITRDFGRNKKIPSSSKPHHSFHVLVMGAVSGRVVLQGRLLDLCRIAGGKVTKKEGDSIAGNKAGDKQKEKIMIEYQPLQEKNKKYYLGKAIGSSVFRDRRFTPKINIGDRVAVHWNHIIEPLNKIDWNNLKKYTRITIDSLNS